MARVGSLSATVPVSQLEPWEAPSGRMGWAVRCPGCYVSIRRPGPAPRANHRGSYKCGGCGRRIVMVGEE